MIKNFLIFLSFLFFMFCLTSCGDVKNASVKAAINNTILITPTANVDNQDNAAQVSLSNDWESRWLNSIPCRLPCWEGITPGQTTVTQAVKLLTQSGLVEKVNLNDTLSRRGTIEWTWLKNNQKGGLASFYTKEDPQIIKYIRPFYGKTYNYEEINKSYGSPSHILATAQVDIHNVQKFIYSVKFIYLTSGFVLTADSYSTEGGHNNKPAITENIKFVSVEFFEANFTGFLQISDPKLLVSWQGFKPFEFYCRNINGTGTVEDCNKLLKTAP